MSKSLPSVEYDEIRVECRVRVMFLLDVYHDRHLSRVEKRSVVAGGGEGEGDGEGGGENEGEHEHEGEGTVCVNARMRVTARCV